MIWTLLWLIVIIQIAVGFHSCLNSITIKTKLLARKLTYNTYGTFADVETRKEREVKKFQEKLGITPDMYTMDTIKDAKTGRELKQEAHRNRNKVPKTKPPKIKLPPIESTFNSTRNLTEIAVIVECLNGCYNGMYKHWVQTTQNGRMQFFEWEKFFNLVGDRIVIIDKDWKRRKIYFWIKYSLNKRHIWITKKGVWEWLYKPYRKSKSKEKKAKDAAIARLTRVKPLVRKPKE